MSRSAPACRSSPRSPSGRGTEHERRCSVGRRGKGFCSCRQSVDHRARRLAGDLHGGAGYDDRQCRAPLYLRRAGGQCRPGVLGGNDLSGVQRHRARGQQFHRQALWPPQLLSGMSRHLHHRLDPLRPCLESAVASAVPHDPGICRRRHGADLAVDPGRFIPAVQAWPGICAVRRRRRRGARRRTHARRLSVRQFLLALVLPDQRPGRRSGLWPGLRAGQGARQAPQRTRRNAQEGHPLRYHRLRPRRHLPRRAGAGAGSRTDGRLVRFRLHRHRNRDMRTCPSGSHTLDDDEEEWRRARS
jgi:hypothetical protein